MIYPDATEIWHDVDIVTHVCSNRFKHKEIFRISGKEQSFVLKKKTFFLKMYIFIWYCKYHNKIKK